MGYLAKFGYDDFAEQVRQRIVQINPNNMTALIVDTETKKRIAIQKIFAAGKPPKDRLPQYPEAYQSFVAMQAAFDRVDALGYQDMPKTLIKDGYNLLNRKRKSRKMVSAN